MRSTGSRADRLGIVPSVLLAAHGGLYVLRADDFDRMPMLFEASLPMEGPGAGSNRDGPGSHLSDHLHETVAHNPALESDRSRLGDAMELEHVLCDVYAKGLDCHR